MMFYQPFMNSHLEHVQYITIKSQLIVGKVRDIRKCHFLLWFRCKWFILRHISWDTERRALRVSIKVYMTSVSLYLSKKAQSTSCMCVQTSDGQVTPPFIMNVSLNFAGFLGNRGWSWAVGCIGASCTTLPTKQSFLLERGGVNTGCMVLYVGTVLLIDT